jgi:hypothetical protein
MRRIALAIVLLIAGVAAALSQTPVYVTGPVTPGNIPQFNSPTGIKDSGIATANAAVFATKATAAAATISASVNVVQTLGYATAGDNGGAQYTRISPSTAAAWRFQSADGQWWALLNRSITPEMFAIVGDGVTDNTAAFISLASWLNNFAPSGVTINNSAGANYLIWPNTSGPIASNLMMLSNINGLTWNFNGSRIFTNTTQFASQCAVVGWANSSNVIVNGPKYVESAWTSLSATLGGVFQRVFETSAPWSNNIHFTNWTQNGGSGALIVGADPNLGGGLAHDISIINADISNTYYAMNFQGSGDNFFARNIKLSNVGRGYFPWNVAHHDVQIIGNGGGPFNDNLLKVYALPVGTDDKRSLSDITLRYKNAGRVNNTASQSLSNLSFQQQVAQPNVSGAVSNGGVVRLTVDTTANMATGQKWFVNSVGGITGTTNGNTWVVTVIDGTHVDLQGSTFGGSYTSGGYLRVPATIRNVKILLDVNNDANQQPVAFNTYKFNADGSIDTTTDGYVMENVEIGGTLENYNYGLSAVDMFNNNSDSAGTWVGETIRNVSLRSLTVNGSSSAVKINNTNVAGLLSLENVDSPAIPWTITAPGSNLRIQNVNASGVTDRMTVVPSTAPANQFFNSLSNQGALGSAQPTIGGIAGLGTGVATALGTNVGSAGAPVVNGGALGTPSSGVGTNITGLPISTGVSGLGTGVATALGVNVGTAGAPVVNGGALGSPSSAGTMPAFTAGGTITAGFNFGSGPLSSCGSALSVTNGGNADITNGRGFLALSDNTATGETALVLLGDGTVTIVSQTGPTNIYVVSTTPAAGKLGIAFNGGTSTHRIFNNTGATIGLGGCMLRTG